MIRIFLSYRREDSADVTGRIDDRLVQQFGRERVFVDVDSMPFGVDFRKHLDEQLAKCDVFLAVIGPDWIGPRDSQGKIRLDDARDYVRIEIESALKRQIPVIPVLVRGAKIPDPERLPDTLRDLSYRNGLAVRSGTDFHRDMDRLVGQLRVQIEEQRKQNSSLAGHPNTSDLSTRTTEAHSEVEQPRQVGIEVAAPPSKGEASQRLVKPIEEELATSTSASQKTTDQSQYYLFGVIGLIIFIGAVAAFLVLEPTSRPVEPTKDLPPAVVEKKEETPTQVTPPYSSTPSSPAKPSKSMGFQEQLVKRVDKKPTTDTPPIHSPEMIKVPSGSFQMGGTEKDNTPVHTVQFIKPFAMARYETTFDEYDRFARATGRQLPDQRVADLAKKLAFKYPEWAVESPEWESAPPKWKHETYPVTNVTWDDATAYAEWLSQQTGKQYRLSTEAEWEYAARSGGTDEAWPRTLNDGRFRDHRRFIKNRPVGMKQPNRLGLYDMNGNVWEWVKDCWHKEHDGTPEVGSSSLATNSGHCDERVVRGGSWFREDFPLERNMSYRYGFNAVGWSDYVGFRLAQDLP